jgi:hypothetical protein
LLKPEVRIIHEWDEEEGCLPALDRYSYCSVDEDHGNSNGAAGVRGSTCDLNQISHRSRDRIVYSISNQLKEGR